MPHYRYIALGPAGERVTGVLEAEHTSTLTHKLRQSNLLVIDAREQGEPLRLLRRRARRVGRKQIARFYSQLADLLRSGVPIVRSLDTLDRQYRESTLGPVIKDVRGQVADGRSLAEAEESAWLQFQKIGSCPSHEFERRGYRTGAAICRHCGLFSSHALATTLDPCVVCGRDDNRASYGPDRHGRWHCEKCYRSIPEPDKSSIHRMADRMRVAADASAARAAQARSTAEGI